ncbi:MAG: hypothetical protein ACQEXJ_09035 [Myxococcota bacterium]
MRGPTATSTLAMLAAAALALAACDDGGTTPGDGTPDGGPGVDTLAPDASGDAPDPDEDVVDPPDDTITPGDAEPDGGESDGDEEDAAVDPDVPPDTGDGCRPDECAIDGECWPNKEVSPDTPCLACLVVVDRQAWSPVDGAQCDDGSACTTEDACYDGECVGVPVPCGDGNPCTDDICDPDTGECSHEPNEAPCEDGNACTDGDTCSGGSCQAGPELDCDDDNPCTKDTCLPAAGCVHQVATEATCDDGDPCTIGDACVDGACVPGDFLNCDDGNLCTVDSCGPDGECHHEPIGHLCEDDNPCTDEACDPDKGCVYPYNNDPCDDGKLCTEGDTCTNGVCKGSPVPVDDGNPCTDDACLEGEGVVHTANTLPCDDGDACTLGDTCADKACVSGGKTPDCDDDNPCTDDTCDPDVGCVHTPNTLPCDDGTVCTEGDTCQGGECVGTPIDCDDGNDCTADSCDPVEGCQSELIVSNACRPQITVTSPERAATLEGSSPFLYVQGQVESGAGPITELKLNGTSVNIQSDGSFSYPYNGHIGGNTLVLEATDSFGSTRKRVQSFLFGVDYNKPTEPKAGMVEQGMAIHLAQEVLDDGDHSHPPDDLATIFEMVLDGYDFSSIMPPGSKLGSVDLVVGTASVYVEDFWAGERSVSLYSTFSGLEMTASVADVGVTVCAGCGEWYEVDADVTMDAIIIDADLDLSVENHQLVANLTNVSVTVDNLDVSAGVLVDWLIDFFEPTIKEEIETSFESEIAGQIEPMLTDALSSLAFQTTFDMPSLDPSGGSVPLSLVTDFQAVESNSSGLTLKLRSGAYAPKVTPYDNLGALARGGCGSGYQKLIVPKADPLELVLSDDTLNELLYAAWNGGLLEVDVPPEMLSDVDLGEYGITDLDISLSGMLQPTLSDCNPDSEQEVHIGDLRVDASLNLLGQPMDVVMYASFIAGVDILVQDGELGVSLTSVKSLESEVTVLQDGLVGSEDMIADLINENLVPSLLDAMGGETLGGFPLPEIDLGAAVDGLPAGTVIAIDPQSITRQGGNTIVGGDLK